MGVAAGRPSDSELRNDPATREDVVRDNRVAVVVRRADAPQRLEERITSGGSVLEGTGGFVENREAGVVPLHVLGWAAGALPRRGIPGRAESTESHTDALEVDAGGRRRRGERSRLGLERPFRAATLRRR